jgi:hypothetical protein
VVRPRAGGVLRSVPLGTDRLVRRMAGLCLASATRRCAWTIDLRPDGGSRSRRAVPGPLGRDDASLRWRDRRREIASASLGAWSRPPIRAVVTLDTQESAAGCGRWFQQRRHLRRKQWRNGDTPSATQQHSDGALRTRRVDDHGVLLQRVKGNTCPGRGTRFPVRSALACEGRSCQAAGGRAVHREGETALEAAVAAASAMPAINRAGNDCDASKLDFKRAGGSFEG